MKIEYRSPTADELATVLRATYAAFGEEPKDDDLERDRRLMTLDRVLTAWDDGRPVGGTASYRFELTIPDGRSPAAGVTWVSVLPSHRRRGILRELMRRQLDDVHERGEPLAILWAASATASQPRRRLWMRNEALSRFGTTLDREDRCGS